MGSLDCVYMRRLDSGKPRAAPHGQNGPLYQQLHPKWKRAPILTDRESQKQRNRSQDSWASRSMPEMGYTVVFVDLNVSI